MKAGFIYPAVLPLRVEIDGTDVPLRAGVEASIMCRSTGSKPPATLDLKIDGSTGFKVLPPQVSRRLPLANCRYQVIGAGDNIIGVDGVMNSVVSKAGYFNGDDGDDDNGKTRHH